MLQNVAELVGRLQLVRVHPHALPNQKRKVVGVAVALDVEAFQQLPGHKLHRAAQLGKELLHIALRLDAQPWQVDRRKRQVAAPGRCLTVRIVHVAYNTRAAAHVAHLGVRVGHLSHAAHVLVRNNPLRKLRIERRVHKGEVREKPLRGNHAGQLEQVGIGIVRIKIHALLNLKYRHGENAGLTIAKPGFRRQKQVLRNHAAFRAGIGAIVQRAKRHLGTGAAMQSVEVVHAGFHRLVRRTLRALDGAVDKPVQQGFQFLAAVGFFQSGDNAPDIHQPFLVQNVPAAILRIAAKLAMAYLSKHNRRALPLHGKAVADNGEQLRNEGLGHARSHVVVEGRNALAPEHVVLVALYGDACQAGVAADAVRLAQKAMSRAEAVLKQLVQVNLAAVQGDGVKVQVMDVDVAFQVRLGKFRRKHLLAVVVLGRGAAVLEHHAHGSVGVDVRVLAALVHVQGRLLREVVEHSHQVGLALADVGAMLPIYNVLLGHFLVDVHQHLFHSVVDGFHADPVHPGKMLGNFRFNRLGNRVGLKRILAGVVHGGAPYGAADALRIVGLFPAIALNDNHLDFPPSLVTASDTAPMAVLP